MNNIENYNEKIFEDIKHIDEEGNEYWLGRELQKTLDYTEWRKFEGVIKKAKIACLTSNISVNDHFVGVDKMVEIGSKTERMIEDYKLSRYACYLIAQNGDSRKESIALAQTYFAVQKRRMELTDNEYRLLSEEDKRLYNRDLIKKGNYFLNQTPKKSLKELEKRKKIK